MSGESSLVYSADNAHYPVYIMGFLGYCMCPNVCVFSPHPGSIDGTVRCWDTRSRRFEPIQVLDEATDSISSLKVAQHELLTGSVYNSTVNIIFL